MPGLRRGTTDDALDLKTAWTERFHASAKTGFVVHAKQDAACSRACMAWYRR